MIFRSVLFASLLANLAVFILPSSVFSFELVNLSLLSGDEVNRLNATVAAAGFSDSELTRLSGNIVAAIELDLEGSSPAITTVRFPEEGQGEVMIMGDNSPNPSFQLGNFLVGRVNVDTQDLRVSVSTINQQIPSDVVDGSFSLEEHQIRSESGIITAKGSIILVGAIDETIDASQTPLVFLPTGTGQIDIVEVADGDPNDLLRTYEVSLAIPVDVSETFEVSPGVNATFTLAGTDPMDEDIQAVGSFTISIAPDGDYNNDGVVDLADYTLWRNNLGAPSGTLPNDPLDSEIGIGQYNVWKQNYGATAPVGGAAQSTAVPEPSILAMMVCSLVLASCIRRR